MDRHKFIDEDLSTLCNSIPRQLVRSSLYFALSHLRTRDRARFERVCAQLRPLENVGKQSDFDWRYWSSSLIFASGRRLLSDRLENTTFGLHQDASVVTAWLKNTPRDNWQSLVDKPLYHAALVMPFAPSVKEKKDLQEALKNARTIRQAMLAILHMAGWGDPANISSRLYRRSRLH